MLSYGGSNTRKTQPNVPEIQVCSEHRWETLRDTARHCETLRDTARHSETLRDTARYCETQRDAARPYETLQDPQTSYRKWMRATCFSAVKPNPIHSQYLQQCNDRARANQVSDLVMMWRYIYEKYAIQVRIFSFVDCETLRTREISI